MIPLDDTGSRGRRRPPCRRGEGGSFSSSLLTFSLLLLVLALGFVVGRVVIANAYIRSGSPPRSGAERTSVAGGQAAAAPPGAVQTPAVPERDTGASEAARSSREERGPDASDLPADHGTAPADNADQQDTEEGASAGDVRYAVQVGAFSSQESARRAQSQLVRAGYQASVRRERQGGSSTYRVVTGGYRTEEDADNALGAIQRAGFPGAFVVSEGD